MPTHYVFARLDQTDGRVDDARELHDVADFVAPDLR